MPTPTEEGSGGVYNLPSPHANADPLAILKPSDEESGMRGGIDKGEACLREVAAFLLDHNRFAGVPMTTLVEGNHPSLPKATGCLSPQVQLLSSGSSSFVKIGSLQQFEKCKGPSGDISHTKIASVLEVQKIAITDLRILNADRHEANILFKKREDGLCELVPIDHGLSLRSVASASRMDLYWLQWPQCKAPFCQEALDFITSLDIGADIQTLEQLNIHGRPIQWFFAACTLLKAGCNAGLSAYDMAILCYRDDTCGARYPQDPSRLEDIVYSTISLVDALLKVEEEDRAKMFGAVWRRLCNAGVLAQFPPVTPKVPDTELKDFPKVSVAPYQEWASLVMMEAVSGDGSNDIDSDVSSIPAVEDGSFEDYFKAIVELLIGQEVALFVSPS
jgi:hypothetical protein